MAALLFITIILLLIRREKLFLDYERAQRSYIAEHSHSPENISQRKATERRSSPAGAPQDPGPDRTGPRRMPAQPDDEEKTVYPPSSDDEATVCPSVAADDEETVLQSAARQPDDEEKTVYPPSRDDEATVCPSAAVDDEETVLQSAARQPDDEEKTVYPPDRDDERTVCRSAAPDEEETVFSARGQAGAGGIKAEERTAFLTLADPGAGGRWDLQLRDGAAVMIGRERDCTLQLSEESVSRYQCVVYLDKAGNALIENRSRSNITKLNAAALTSPQPLRPGDRIRCGRTVLTVEALSLPSSR